MDQRIKEVRRYFKKTQEEFGESLGASRNNITSYETGRVIPNKTFIQLLCKTYQINEDWLTTGEGSMLIETQEDIMERFAQENGLSYHVKKILEFYLSLDEEKQKAADELFQDFIDSYDNKKAADLEKNVKAKHTEISEDNGENIQTFKIASRNGQSELRLSKEQRRELIETVENHKKTDLKDLF